MLVWGLDLATRTGFAHGQAGAVPTSGALVLKKPGQPRAVALANLLYFLNDAWSKECPDLVITEAPLGLQAWHEIGSSQDNVRMHYGLHAVVEALCVRHEIRHVEEYPAVVRKHFIGKAHAGGRKQTKWECVVRARLLGLMPKDCEDEDRADAIAVHDYGCATYAQRAASITNFALFGQADQAARSDRASVSTTQPGGRDVAT